MPVYLYVSVYITMFIPTAAVRLAVWINVTNRRGDGARKSVRWTGTGNDIQSCVPIYICVYYHVFLAHAHTHIMCIHGPRLCVWIMHTFIHSHIHLRMRYYIYVYIYIYIKCSTRALEKGPCPHMYIHIFMHKIMCISMRLKCIFSHVRVETSWKTHTCHHCRYEHFIHLYRPYTHYIEYNVCCSPGPRCSCDRVMLLYVHVDKSTSHRDITHVHVHTYTLMYKSWSLHVRRVLFVRLGHAFMCGQKRCTSRWEGTE
jgi:hypothetical protein